MHISLLLQISFISLSLSICLDSNVNLNDFNLVDVGNINGRDPDNFVLHGSTSGDNAIPKFDGTGGKTIQQTGILCDDSNNLTGINALSCTTIDTGLGATEVYAMNQNVRTTDDVTFGNLNTDQVTFQTATTTSQAALDRYCYDVQLNAWETGTVTASSSYVFAIRIGNLVTVFWGAVSFSVSGADVPVAYIRSDIQLPTDLRPSGSAWDTWTVVPGTNGGTNGQFDVLVSNDGYIYAYANTDHTTVWSTGAGLIRQGSVSYQIGL